MKVLASELAYFLRGRARQNLKVLLLYCTFLFALLLTYASIFRYLMWHLEGREYSFMAGSKYPPAKPGAFKVVDRSKRLFQKML